MNAQQIRDEIAARPELQAFVSEGNLQAVATALGALLPPAVSSRRITALGVRALGAPLLPRNRFRLLQVLKDAETSPPAWLDAVLTALAIPAEDHAALADDLGSAHYWIHTTEGLDIGTDAARSMLDVIAAADATAAPACAAVKALAESPATLDWREVKAALEEV